jgi:hypothetical protein
VDCQVRVQHEQSCNIKIIRNVRSIHAPASKVDSKYGEYNLKRNPATITYYSTKTKSETCLPRCNRLSKLSP